MNHVVTWIIIVPLVTNELPCVRKSANYTSRTGHSPRNELHLKYAKRFGILALLNIVAASRRRYRRSYKVVDIVLKTCVIIN